MYSTNGEITSLDKVLESAVAIRTLNTEVRRVSENLDNLNFILKFSKDDKLSQALQAQMSKYGYEQIGHLDRMLSEIEFLKKMLANGEQEIRELKGSLYVEEGD